MAEERIPVQCPACGHMGRLRPELGGRKLRCKKCGAVFVAAGGSEGPEPSKRVPDTETARNVPLGLAYLGLSLLLFLMFGFLKTILVGDRFGVLFALLVYAPSIICFWRAFKFLRLRNVRVSWKCLAIAGGVALLLVILVWGPLLTGRDESPTKAGYPSGARASAPPPTQQRQPDRDSSPALLPDRTALAEGELPLALPPLSQGWQRVIISDVGVVDVPPTMEIQGAYRRLLGASIISGMRIETAGYANIVIQQRGLDAGEPEASATYVRFIVETQCAEPGDYERLASDRQLSPIELAALSAARRFFLEQNLERLGGKVLDWHPVRQEKVNGVRAVVFRYKRQHRQNPIVHVTEYHFGNYDRGHSVTMSYRESEAEIWRSDLEKMLENFRITNIR